MITNFMPHGVCYLWEPPVLWLHVLSDAGIAAAYFMIPLLLIRAMRKNLLPFGGLFFMFSAFILLCGLTHVMKIVTVWFPVYYWEGAVAASTAVVSLWTALVFLNVLRKHSFLLPSATLLELRRLTMVVQNITPPLGPSPTS